MTPESVKHIYMIFAHPDDLNGCMALALILKQMPCYRLHIVDLTRGERGLVEQNVSMSDCAAMRIKEEYAVCAELGIEPVFLNEIDGEAYACRECCDDLTALFRAEKPCAVFAHWPLDTHFDHVMSTAAAMKAISQLQERPELYFFRQSRQTRKMPEEIYVPFDDDIMDEKCRLMSLYACQWGDEIAARQRIDNESCGFRVQGKHKYAECFASWQFPGEGRFFDEFARHRLEYNV